MPEFDKNPNESFQPQSGWLAKFRYAWAGVRFGLRTQSSFWVHLPVAVGVISLGLVMSVSRMELSILLLCIALVLSLEMVNTALESLAKAVTTEFDENIANALNVSAAAVLIAAILSIAIGCIVLIPKIFERCDWLV